MEKGLVLIVDDDPSIAKALEKLVREDDFLAFSVNNGMEATQLLAKREIDVALVDLNLPGFSGLQILQFIKNNRYLTEVILITGSATIDTAVSSLKQGAYDYLTKPFDNMDRVLNTVRKAWEKEQLLKRVQNLESGGDRRRDSFQGIIGRSAKMQELFRLVENVGHSESNILVLGESGTGKELFARALHETSPRASKAFVVINCSALSENLLETELFGHKKGSFTGAISDKKGLFEEGNGGTVFLDEIGEISPMMQVKLLRVLQDGEVKPVGGTEAKHVDVRLIAATNRDLYQRVKEGKFREDLYYRLNVVSFQVPPLRDRMEDVPLLAYHFLQRYAEKTGKKVTKISVDAMQTFQEYRWVGNVRELENVIERAVVMTTSETITARDLPPALLGQIFYLSEDQNHRDLIHLTYQEAKDKAVSLFNKTYIATLLQRAGGNISVASARAGMDRSNFKKILKKCGINITEFKKGGGS
ncbi:MAG: sigma-54-dependent Fis family transcriptional regulator [Deltaproteobacteria bacterium]|nr:sigma-54-dependent Fis family transcriptional regulator [Deltaproteobacteria bacterium]